MWWIVFKKEVIDNLRDKRSMGSMVISALLTPLLVVALLVVLSKTMLADPADAPIVIAVDGAENAPALVAYLRQNNFQITPAPENAEQAIRDGDLDVVVIIPDNFVAEMEAGNPAPVQVVADTSRQSALRGYSLTQSALRQYSSLVGVLRLQARGVDASILSGLDVELVDVAPPASDTLLFLNMLPYVIIMTVFMGGMYVVIDATAGERERGSLEPLLINPVRRGEMVMGKLIASIPFAILSLILTLAALLIFFNVLPLEEFVGMPLRIPMSTIYGLFFVSLPLVILASGLQMLVATYTRSFKEAQTYLSLMPLIAGLPGMFLAFLPVKPGIGNMLIPAFSQAILMDQVLRSEMILPQHVWISTLSTLVIGGLVIFASIQLYRKETILVGKK